jgi:anti-anti-sigma factor
MVGELPVDRIHDALKEHYVDDGVLVIRVNLESLEHIDLEGVGALLDLWRESRRRGKRFVAEGARGQVKEKLVTTGLSRLLETGQP